MVDVSLLYSGACLMSTGLLHWKHNVCTHVCFHLHGACSIEYIEANLDSY